MPSRTGFPEFGRFYVQEFPRRTQVQLSPLRLDQFRPRPRAVLTCHSRAHGQPRRQAASPGRGRAYAFARAFASPGGPSASAACDGLSSAASGTFLILRGVVGSTIHLHAGPAFLAYLQAGRTSPQRFRHIRQPSPRRTEQLRRRAEVRARPPRPCSKSCRMSTLPPCAALPGLALRKAEPPEGGDARDDTHCPRPAPPAFRHFIMKSRNAVALPSRVQRLEPPS